MVWINIFALICLIIGLANSAKRLKSIRSQEPPGADISWKQPPFSPWRYETPTAVAITLHALGLVCLAVFVLNGAAHLYSLNAFQTANLTFLLLVLALFAVSFTAYASGMAVAYPFIQSWIRPASYGICNDGILYGGLLIDWESYSCYEVGPDDNMISLYSSYSPQLRTWVIQPPAESFALVLEVIKETLPSASPAEGLIPWQRSSLAMILTMTVLLLGALLPAAWGWLNNQPWVWVYALLAFLFVRTFGIRLIVRFDGRG